MKRIRSILLLTTCFGMNGCVSEVSIQHLDAARRAGNTIQSQIFYTGSRGGYDYFYVDHFIGMNESVKLASGLVKLDETMPKTRDRSKWRIYNPPSSRFTSHPPGYYFYLPPGAETRATIPE